VRVRRGGLIGLLCSQAVSLTGTRVSMIAVPWFVLTSTGSATNTGLVAACEMAPYVLSIVRIVAALLFFEHGLAKLFGFPPQAMPAPARWRPMC